jgi:hypothetical protein
MGSHDPGHGTLIRYGQGAIAQAYRAFNQLFRKGSAFQKAETGAAVQFSVGRRGRIYIQVNTE